MRLLLVEDDRALARGLDKALTAEGYVVDWVETAEAALFLAGSSEFDAVVLDLGLPDMDGMDVLSALRKRQSVPVLILTARDAIDDKVTGLDLGADDYLTKPFELPELVARLRAMVRRRGAQQEHQITIGDVCIDTHSKQVTRAGEAVELSGKEYSLLLTFVEHRGRLLSRDQLENKLYTWGDERSSNAVEVHIHNLRKKIGRDAIRTVRGIGYGLVVE